MNAEVEYVLKFLSLFILTSSCIDESQICKGLPLCNDKNDLKWCKNATTWNEQPGADYLDIEDHSVCTLSPQSDELAPQGDEVYILGHTCLGLV